MPKISVIIPVYNGEQYLENTISSVLDQTYTNFELIIVNDGSQDQSKQIIKNFEERDTRIHYYEKENGGICNSRNYGLSKCKGEYVVFIDQDDRFDSNMLYNYIRNIEMNKADLVIFGRHCAIINDSNRIINEFDVKPKNKIIKNKSDVINEVLNVTGTNELNTIWNCIYKKEILDINSICFDEYFKHGFEDTMFNIEFSLSSNTIVFSDEIYYYYQLRRGQSTISKQNDNILNDINHFCEKMDGLLNEYDYDNNLFKYYVFRFFTKAYIKSSPKGLSEKKSYVRKMLGIREFKNSLSVDCRLIKNSKMYNTLLYLLSKSLANNNIIRSVLLLDVLSLSVRLKRKGSSR